jgi:hypothetical protein
LVLKLFWANNNTMQIIVVSWSRYIWARVLEH